MHHQDFFQLIRFLFGSRTNEPEEIEHAFLDFGKKMRAKETQTTRPGQRRTAPINLNYFCFDFRLRLIALQGQRRDSGVPPRGVT